MNGSPTVSVLIPQWGHTEATLRSVAAVRRSDYHGAIEILIWDNGSPEGPGDVALRDDVRVLQAPENVGFGPAVNGLAAQASGQLLLILNNDTVVAPSAIKRLVDCVVATGTPATPQYRSFTGDLIEVGGVVGRGGHAGQLFKGQKLPTALGRMRWEAYYGSAAAFMIPAAMFRELGGFAEEFAPAYYEDTDLCVRLSKQGLGVTVEPRAVVFHDEGTTGGRSLASGAKAGQVRNRSTFVDRHGDWLDEVGDAGERTGLERLLRPADSGLRVLWIAPTLPRVDRDGGGRRIFSMVETLAGGPDAVAFYANTAQDEERYGRMLEQLGVPWFGGSHPPRWDGGGRQLSRLDDLETLLGAVSWDVLVVSFARHLHMIRETLQRGARDVPVVVDDGDVHFLRHERGRSLGLEIDDWLDKETELAAYADSDGVITASDYEDRVLRSELPTLPTHVYTVSAPTPSPGRESQGSGVLFLGNYGHPPNVDAVRWWLDEVAVKVADLLGHDERLRLIGAGTDGAFGELAPEQQRYLEVVGWVPDLEPAFLGARVFLAPLRYGAGTKGKILDALSFGTPTVTTSVGAEGFPPSVADALVICDDAEGLAAAVAELLLDDDAWRDRHERSLSAAHTLHMWQDEASRELHDWLQARVDGGRARRPHPRLRELPPDGGSVESRQPVATPRPLPSSESRTEAIDVCERPVFVVGAPRSGTSMMQHSLRRHPELWGGEESDFMIPLIEAAKEVHAFGQRRGPLHWLSNQQVTTDEFLRHLGYGVNALYTQRAQGLRWVEQTPQYTLHLNDLTDMFPGAQYVYMLRDGRDVVHSLRHFVNPVEHDRACRIWRNFAEAGIRFRESSRGDQLHVVSYERIVADTEQVLRDICDFLELEFEMESANFIRSGRINSSFRDSGTARERVVPAWRTWTPQERKVFDDIAGDLLIQLGFESDRTWLSQEVAV